MFHAIFCRQGCVWYEDLFCIYKVNTVCIILMHITSSWCIVQHPDAYYLVNVSCNFLMAGLCLIWGPFYIYQVNTVCSILMHITAFWCIFFSQYFVQIFCTAVGMMTFLFMKVAIFEGDNTPCPVRCVCVCVCILCVLTVSHMYVCMHVCNAYVCVYACVYACL